MTDQEFSPATVQNEGGSKPFKKPRKTGRAQEVLDGLTDVYRHYDANGVLLYVGISLSAFTRLKGHRRDSAWFKQISHITVEHCETRVKAELAEAWAIRHEKPLYNKNVPFAPDYDPFDIEEERVRAAIDTAGIIKLFAERQGVARNERRAKFKQKADEAGIASTL